MRSFKPYLFSATAFALLLTALVLNTEFGSFIGKFDALVFIPIITGILVSGNAHMPSEFGIYLGFFIEWFIVALLAATIVWIITKKKARAAT